MTLAHPPKDHKLLYDLAVHILLMKWTSFLPYISAINMLMSYYLGFIDEAR